VRIRIDAESLFVVGDSARFERSDRRWVVAREDTVRAWRLSTDGPGGFAGWVDEQGRIVRLSQTLGFDLVRTAYEVAFENWRATRVRDGARVTRRRDVLETTAIAASVPMAREAVRTLRLRLRGVELGGFDLAGNGQRLAGDTIEILRARTDSLVTSYAALRDRGARRLLAPSLAPEPLVQSSHPEIRELAYRLKGSSGNPTEIARRLLGWVHDSLHKEVTVSVPSALQVLRARAGDCNEHTQLFVALARAVDIPARTAAGLAYIGGRFYYHAWPEVWLGRWVPVDPTFGQFPADAAHIRFVYGGLGRQAELVRLMGTLRIDVLDARDARRAD
jgi:transglutaminase-like putative cysteine protease